jgi:hypothetical protein
LGRHASHRRPDKHLLHQQTRRRLALRVPLRFPSIHSSEKAKKIAEGVKAAFQSADPTLVWFEDPAARALADIQGFHGTEGWYGGYAKNKAMLVRVESIVSDAAGSTAVVTVFAKSVTRRDLK